VEVCALHHLIDAGRLASLTPNVTKIDRVPSSSLDAGGGGRFGQAKLPEHFSSDFSVIG